MDTVEVGERDEKFNDAFIAQGGRQRRREQGERLEEALWRESVAKFNARQEREIRARWYGYHCEQAERHRRTLEALIAHHEEQTERLCEENGNTHQGEG